MFWKQNTVRQANCGEPGVDPPSNENPEEEAGGKANGQGLRERPRKHYAVHGWKRYKWKNRGSGSVHQTRDGIRYLYRERARIHSIFSGTSRDPASPRQNLVDEKLRRREKKQTGYQYGQPGSYTVGGGPR